jgi:fatty acid/phospholipid biosynthesis enzyme
VGAVYARKILEFLNPGGLLSMGKEEGKGNEVVNCLSLFKSSGLNLSGTWRQ